MFSSDFKIGILGGGQLGKMLCMAAAKWNLNMHILESDAECPAAAYCTHFTQGDFKNYDDVLQFGRDKNIVTVEIEHVNTEALRELKKMGVTVHPDPDMLDVIKDKGQQNIFYAQHQFPIAPFKMYKKSEDIHTAMDAKILAFPFVQKTCTAGYDGRGVAVIRNADDLQNNLLKGPCITEDLVDIEKELAVIVARNPSGDIAVFPPVEMVFDPVANLVDYLISPAQVSKEITDRANQLAKEIITAFDICGVLAIEFFLTKSGELLVNEVAPRPHNSGHHTIESCRTSQFEQHLRAILNLRLGDTTHTSPAAMVNILGPENHTGVPQYAQLKKALDIENTHVHIYGKKMSKPFRKMGHITITDEDIEAVVQKAIAVKEVLK